VQRKKLFILDFLTLVILEFEFRVLCLSPWTF
jgi:hypothetical protein